MKLLDSLSPVYDHLLPHLKDVEVPTENFAVCSSCQHTAHPKQIRYLTKCCDYHPLIPNYMIGHILNDLSPGNEEGRKRILKKIQDKIGVSPFGIIAPLEHTALFKKTREKDYLTTKEDIQQLKCPYLNVGQCSIWKYRGEQCATYFCQSVGGTEGKEFWNLMTNYLRNIEYKLAHFAWSQSCLQTNDYSFKDLRTDPSTLQNEDSSLKSDHYDKIWSVYIGKEIDYFKECTALIQQLSSEQLNGIFINRTKELESDLMRQLPLFKEATFPTLLKMNPKVRQEKLPNNTISLQNMANGKDIVLSEFEYNLSSLFTGELQTDQIIRKMLVLNKELVRKVEEMIKKNILIKI